MKSRQFLSFICMIVSAGSYVMADEPFAGLKLKLGSGEVPAGYKLVTTETLCSKESGFGFESAAGLKLANDKGVGITGSQPFSFSAVLPEGNYKVTVTLGDPDGESQTTVKAELRRMMLNHIVTQKGEVVKKTFMVNIRTPKISGGGEVKLKPREKEGEAFAWDDRLTIEFCDSRPVVSAIEIDQAPTDTPVVYLLGDSTVADQSKEPWNSWGQMLTQWFKPTVVVANHSESGESYSSAKGAGRLKKIMSIIKKGDYLFMQFGHNDSKNGSVEKTKYKESVKEFIDSAKAKGAIPVVIASMERSSGVTKPTLGEYPQAALDVAKAEGVASIDLHASSMIFYQALGKDLKKAFQDGTHHNNYGSYEISKLVIMGIKQNKLGLADDIVADFKEFDPSKPDPVAEFKVAESAGTSTTKPYGD